MAKEYFHLQDQYFEFNNEVLTVTVVGADVKSKTLNVQHLTELQFQGQLFTFKGNVLRAQAAAEDGITDPSMLGPLFEYSTEEVFNTKRAEAVEYITSMM
jgi:sorbitol-specific phosphotransferase system component IIA